ncbi:MAG TPA: hypothetical protein VFE62_25430 [Gemmataceae bacterium]|nr:hypothetical protein [Gemmataceae bacterium]
MRLDKPAANQRAILIAFQSQSWPAWIANPLKPDHAKDDRQRLADAVYKLNRHPTNGQICFRRDGRGTGVIWEFVDKKSEI